MATIRIVKLLVRPALFTGAVCATCFCGAAICQAEAVAKKRDAFKRSWLFNSGNIQNSRLASRGDGWFQDYMGASNEKSLTASILNFRRQVYEWKCGLTQGGKIAWVTILINSLVFLGWKTRPLLPIMSRYFLSDSTPSKISSLPMLLSCFSHVQFFHLGVNMFALYSFSNMANHFLGPQELVGLFLSAGVVSSLTSLTYRLAIGSKVPSVGASGALMGVLAYLCYTSPDQTLLLLLIPVKAGTALMSVMAFDTAGVILKWGILDHAAHLGGSCFGLWYAAKGQEMFRNYRIHIIKPWIEFKKKMIEMSQKSTKR